MLSHVSKDSDDPCLFLKRRLTGIEYWCAFSRSQHVRRAPCGPQNRCSLDAWFKNRATSDEEVGTW